MARTVLSPQARLAQLRVAKKRADTYPAKGILTAEPMAKLLGVTWQGALRRWCNELPGFEQSGCFVRGGQGIEWTFKVRKTTDWLIRYFEREEAALKSKSRRTEKVLALPDGSMPDGYTLLEVDKSMAIYQRIAEQKREAGLWVPREHVENILREVLVAARDHCLGVIGVADPNGVFPPEIREKVERATVAQAAAFADRCEEISRSHEGVVAR